MPDATSAPADGPFHSVAEMRAEHRELLQRHVGAPGETFVAALERFFSRGRQTGALLDSDRDRSAAQRMLDYWPAFFPGRGGLVDVELADFDPESAPALDDSQCPYLGLNAFEEATAGKFFGREGQVSEIVDALADRQLLIVSGPSGSGKSSLVLAGVLPALKAGGVPGSRAWRYRPTIVPGSDPLASLARAVTDPPTDAAAADFRADSAGLTRVANAGGPEPVVLVVDQFEEMFTMTTDEAARRAFVDNICGLARGDGPAHRVILTVRSDYDSYLARFASLQDMLAPATGPFQKAVHIRVTPTPLGAADLRRVIEEPARRVGLRFADGLVDRLVQDVVGEPAALPLLQFTLLKLWETRSRNRVTTQAYDALGGARLALSRSADEFYTALIPQDQRIVRHIFERLVRKGEGMELVRERVPRQALVNAIGGNAAAVLDRLVAAHLLRMTAGDRPEDAQVEVVHEALVRNWQRFVDWQDESRDEKRRRDKLVEAAREWSARGRDAALLFRGDLLTEAEAWKPDTLTPVEKEFVAESKAAADREREQAERLVIAEREQIKIKEEADRRELAQALALAEAERKRSALKERMNKRLRLALGSVMLLFVIATGMALYASNRESKAKYSAIEAREFATSAKIQEAKAAEFAKRSEYQTELANQAIRELKANQLLQAASRFTSYRPDISLLLAQKAVQLDPDARSRLTPELVKRLWQSTPGEMPSSALRGAIAMNPPTGLEFDSFRRGPAGSAAPASQMMAINHTGQRVAYVDPAGKAYIWDTEADESHLLEMAANDVINFMAFHQDDRHLTTVTRQGDVYLWNAHSGEQVGAPQRMKIALPVVSAAVSKNGDRVAIVGQSPAESAMIWNTKTAKAHNLELPPSGPVSALTFGNNDKWIAGIGRDGKAWLWDAASGKLLRSIPLEGPFVVSLAVPNGLDPSGVIATTYSDGRVVIWDTFSPDCECANWRETCSFSALPPPGNRPPHSGWMAFGGDGETVVTWAGPQMIGVWSAKTGEFQFGRRKVLNGAGSRVSVFSSNGKCCAVAELPSFSENQAANKLREQFSGGLVSSGDVWALVANKIARTYMPPPRVAPIGLYKIEDPGFRTRDLLGRPGPSRSVITVSDYEEILDVVAPSQLENFRNGIRLTTRLDETANAVTVIREALSVVFSAPGFEDTATAEAEAEANRLAAEVLLNQGLERTRQELGEDPQAYIQKAKEISPETVSPLILGSAWRATGTSLARQGKVSEATVAFVEAKKADPSLPIEPETEAKRLADAASLDVAYEMARQRKLPEAVAAFQKAKELNPGLPIDPEKDARRLTAAAWKTYAENRARGGELDDALAAFQQASDLDRGLNIDPKEEVNKFALTYYKQLAGMAVSTLKPAETEAALRHAAELNPQLKINAHVLARQLIAGERRAKALNFAGIGNVEAAAVELMRAKELDDRLTFEPVKEAKRLSAKYLLDRGRQAATMRLNIDLARKLLDQANEYDPTLKIDVETEIRFGQLSLSRILAQSGRIRDAVELIGQIKNIRPDRPIDATYWNSICWFGSLYGHADLVQNAGAGDKAVNTALPTNVNGYRDSRGLARALTGDVKGAVEDFIAFVRWKHLQGSGKLESVAKREAWIKALNAGKNPKDIFTPDVLLELRQE